MGILGKTFKEILSTSSNAPQASGGYQFSADWFSGRESYWHAILTQLKPTKLLEIGSYEGRSTVFLIEQCAQIVPAEIVCIDSWQGGVEHDINEMAEVEQRFDANVALAQKHDGHPVKVNKIKSLSYPALIRLSTNHRGTFDFIYVDGSHQAPDVLADAVLSFELLRRGGIMIFDDYLWSMEPFGQQDPLNMPKPAIDAFINIYQRKLRVLPGIPLYQIVVEKLYE